MGGDGSGGDSDGGDGSGDGSGAGGSSSEDGSSSGSSVGGSKKKPMPQPSEIDNPSENSETGALYSKREEVGWFQSYFYEEVGEDGMRVNKEVVFWAIVILLILIGIAFYFIVLRKDKQKKKTGGYLKRVNKMQASNVSSFMKKNNSTLTKDDSIYDALEIFIEKYQTIIPIMSGKRVEGVITKKGFLKKVGTYKYDDMSKIKVSKIIEKDFSSCDSEDSLGRVVSLMEKSKSDSLLVLDKNKNLKGVISYLTLIEVMSSAKFEITNPPLIREVFGKNAEKVDSQDKIMKVRKKFEIKDIDYSVVMKNGKPVGIVTAKDLLTALYNSVKFDEAKIESIMSSPIVFENPGNLLTKTFKTFILRKFNYIPLSVSGELEGVASMKGVVNAYYRFVVSAEEESEVD